MQFGRSTSPQRDARIYTVDTTDRGSSMKKPRPLSHVDGSHQKATTLKQAAKSIPISQQGIYDNMKRDKRKKIVDYSMKNVKSALGINYNYKKVKEIDYSTCWLPRSALEDNRRNLLESLRPHGRREEEPREDPPQQVPLRVPQVQVQKRHRAGRRHGDFSGLLLIPIQREVSRLRHLLQVHERPLPPPRAVLPHLRPVPAAHPARSSRNRRDRFSTRMGRRR